jgi:hypothetical protein
MRKLIFFSALVTEFGPGQILGPAFCTKNGFRFFLGRMTASGTELRIGRQVFPAVAALDENQLLVTAHGTEFGRYGDLA